MQKILTEAVLRSELIPAGTRSYTVSKDTVVTPTAREYLKKRGIELKTAPAGPGRSMSRTEIRENGSYTYVDAVTGKGYREKPEDMTHLRGNRLVKKSDPRIAFRGQLDSLEAHILECQAQVCEQGNAELCGCLGELLDHVRDVLGAEVRDEPLAQKPLFGYDHDRLRYVSHHVKEEIGIDHPIPDYRMGRMALMLNTLRTRIREAELGAVAAFPGERPDIIEEMNRLSSAAYILFCRQVAKQWGGGL
ncbi:hypothetical protein [Enterocloster asparagiformis]|uniref:hypothetical protein n=1 Tax=Enterocloster asparagiformis TaxID=333367 RepID=UPI000463ABFF|nr:hypothetical protein [Enterocloster asparagiformis]